MKTLTDRKIAEQQKLTYETQQIAQATRKDLEAATASANMQAEVVQAERNVEIAEKVADSKIKTATGDATSKTINAEADAKVTTVNALAEAEATKAKGNATAEITKSIGNAEAEVLKQKTESLGNVAYAQIQIAESLAKNKIKLVPDVLISGDKANGNGMLDALLATEYFRDYKSNKNKSEVKGNQEGKSE